MATNPTAQYWIRTDGNDANGAGYDSGISGAATNYSDQASSQATFTLLTLLSGTLTDTGSLGLFTAAMIGNAVNVPGQGYYWITARTNGNVVTVTPATGATTSFTTQPGKVGGALRQLVALNNGGGVSAPTTASPLVPGNQVNVRASGSGSVGSPDYTLSSYATFPSGDVTNGMISWVAYNGMPYVVGVGLTIYQLLYHKSVNIYWSASSNSLGNFGIFGTPTSCTWVGGVIDANNQSGLSGLGGTSGMISSCQCIGTEIVGNGTLSANGVHAGSYGCLMKNCKIHGWGGYGVYEHVTTSGVQVSSCAVYSNVSGGVYLQTLSVLTSTVENSTIDNNTGPGIEIANTASAAWTKLVNNNITFNGTYGITIDAGTSTANTAAIAFEDYNNVFNNTSGGYHNLNAGTHDVSLNPGYTAGSGAYTPTSNVAALIAAAAPIGFA